MRVAQKLYEEGFITYMRTDSVNLSTEAIEGAGNTILETFGDKYHEKRLYANKSKSVQEAHEAIRPTDFSKDSIHLDKDHKKLYDLIRKRAIASQMSDAQMENTTVKIVSDKYKHPFVARGEVVVFDGFLKVYLEGKDDEDEGEDSGLLPQLLKGEKLYLENITATERFSKPAPRYSEASLVKKMEELGIGRPSTYAPTISTIQNRGYIEKGDSEGIEREYLELILEDGKIKEGTLSEKTGSNRGRLVPTSVGRVVNNFLVSHFKDILDYNFTAKVEQDFDNIAKGGESWVDMIKSFYGDFHPNVKRVEDTAERESGERVLGKDPKTGKQVIARLGRYGPMVQLGHRDDEDIKHASIIKGKAIETITLEEALRLFELPRVLGTYKDEEVKVNIGRYGPYVHHNGKFVSLGKQADVFSVTLEDSIELIKQKEKENQPITNYKGHDVTKGVGRFGPFLKWDGIYVNVNKKYDFENLSESDIETLIETKLKKRGANKKK
ncbi:DNA topoisomerase 1 [Elysia marginata]|uniref:DNA topoisomerase 1 n=1 Tax=Elysia marginata TaxID=1093978 RepID=A0AAV4GVU3_9GAST|nr:DNA topoisomerase 1 [Elysia marginata]